MSVVTDTLSMAKKTLETRLTQGKHNAQRQLFFMVVKSTLCVMVLVSLAIALYSWLLDVVLLVYLASLITAGVFFICYVVVNIFQALLHKCRRNKNDEISLIVIALIEAFFEGVAEGDAKKQANEGAK